MGAGGALHAPTSVAATYADQYGAGVGKVWMLWSFLGIAWSCRLLDGVERWGLFSRRAIIS